MFRPDIKLKFFDELGKRGSLSPKQKELLHDVDSFADLENRLKTAGWMEVEALAKLKSGFFKLAYADLVGEKVSQEVIKIIPKELAENYLAVAFAKKEREDKKASYIPVKG